MLNDLAHSFSLLIRLDSLSTNVPLSPEAIKKLEDSRNAWQNTRLHDFSWLLRVTKWVAIGVILEGPELVYELFNTVKRLKKKTIAEHAPAWITFVGLIGWILVAIGVAGEFWIDGRVNTDDDNIQSINITLLEDASASAGRASSDAARAEVSAMDASDASGKAVASAGTAMNLASGAKREADSYEQEIVSAKQQATDAVSRLADAEQRLSDSTQREAAAEARLSAIKTPRSLVRVTELVNALKPFKGTEFTLNAFMDDESNKFSVIVAQALKDAGWIRRQPAGMNIGIPTMRTVFAQGEKAENVPSCLDTGIAVHVVQKESLAELQARPLLSLSQKLRAGIALNQMIGPDISPPDENNVTKGVLDPEPGEEVLRICIGRKP